MIKHLIIAAMTAGVSVGAMTSGADAQVRQIGDRCFDKGLLRYVDCPSATPVFTPPPPPVMPIEKNRSWYASLFAGYTFADSFDHDFTVNGVAAADAELGLDDGFNVGGAIGYDFGEIVRAEVEVSYQGLEADSYSAVGLVGGVSGDADTLFVLANLWFDLETESIFTPYAGGGVGVGFVDFEVRDGGGNGPDGTNAGFGFQLGAGLGVELAEQVSLDVGYRFKGLVGVDADDAIAPALTYVDGDLYSHTVQAGLTFRFNP